MREFCGVNELSYILHVHAWKVIECTPKKTSLLFDNTR